MPLDKQEIRVPFGGGVDTKTDRKQVVPGKLLELKNGTFQETGQIKKREAFETPYSDQTVGWDAHNRDTIEEGSAIYRRGQELVITARQTNIDTGLTSHEDGWYMYSRDGVTDEWKNIGTRQPLRLAVEGIAPPNAQNVIPDVAMLESATGPSVEPVTSPDFICYAWLELVDPADAADNRSARVTIKDYANDATIIDRWSSDVTLSAVDVQGVHVTGINGTPPDFYVWLAVPSTNDIYMATASTVTLSTIGNPVVKITDLNVAATPLWDTCTTYLQGHGTCSVVAYQDDSVPPDIYVRWFDETGTEVDQAFINDDPKGAITVFSELDDRTGDAKVVVVWQSAADNKIYGQTYSSDGVAYAGPYLIVNVDYDDRIRNITGCNDTASDFYVANSSFYRIFYEVANDNANSAACWCDVRSAAVEYDGTNPQAPINISNAALASKAFEYESKARVWVVHDSFGLIDAVPNPDVYNPEIQNTYFLLSLQGDFPPDTLQFRTDARCLGARAHGQSFSPSLSAVVSPATGQHLFAGLRKDVIVETINGFSLDSVVGITTDFPVTAQPSTELGPCVQTGGGYVGCADGRFQELGFHLYPECLVAAVTAIGGAAVDWQYTVVYEWTDREGQIHRSAPAIPIDVSCNDGDHVAITCNALTFGDPGKLEDVRCVLYRTEDDGTLFYRLPTPSHQLNNPQVSRITVYDSYPAPGPAAADTTIVDYETLYTTGAVVENLCPPASSIMNVFQDRVMLVPDEDRTAIWFSKLKRYGQGLSFAGGFFVKRIADGGDTTALAAMDGREIVFKESQIRAFSGAGPNDTGEGGGAFSEDVLITADAGCTDRASVVWTDKGIIFKSHKGIYLLGRNFQVSYIGAPVEDYNQYRVIKSELVETKNQVRFLLENQSMLVFDYLVGQWSVFEAPQGAQFTPWDCVDSAMWQNQYVMIKDDGVVYLETADYQDGTTDYIPLDLTTAWIKLSGLQGYQRVYWISLLGEVYDRCTINYEIYYDYVDTNPQTGSIVVDAAFQADPPAQFRVKPRGGNGKSQAVKIRLYDATATGATTYRGFAISDIMLQIGKKPGVMRQGITKSR